MKKRDRVALMERAAKEAGFESYAEKPIDSKEKDFRQIFMGEDCEPITAKLFVELLKKGITEKDLKFFITEGFNYCRPRNSFLCMNPEDGSVCEVGKKVHIHSLMI